MIDCFCMIPLPYAVDWDNFIQIEGTDRAINSYALQKSYMHVTNWHSYPESCKCFVGLCGSYRQVIVKLSLSLMSLWRGFWYGLCCPRRIKLTENSWQKFWLEKPAILEMIVLLWDTGQSHSHERSGIGGSVFLSSPSFRIIILGPQTDSMCSYKLQKSYD